MANYRAVYKSEHLGVVDLEEMIETKQSMIVTIKEVKQEHGVVVAGTRGNFNIAYFAENIKPLVLNATNAGVVRKLAGGSTDTDNWKNFLVELFVDPNVKMKGQIVGGVRIKGEKPIKQKQNATQQTMDSAFSKKATIEEIEKHYNVSQELKEYYAKLQNTSEPTK
jgi:hypothetical protein